jgi:hypothetical protein
MASNNGGLDKASAGREGGKFLTPFGRDNSSHKLENVKGKDLRGSSSNLGHSIVGASANLRLKQGK